MCCNVIYGGQRVTKIMKFLWQQEWDGEFQGFVSQITWPKYNNSLSLPFCLSGLKMRFFNCRSPSMYLLCRINSFVYTFCSFVPIACLRQKLCDTITSLLIRQMWNSLLGACTANKEVFSNCHTHRVVRNFGSFSVRVEMPTSRSLHHLTEQ